MHREGRKRRERPQDSEEEVDVEAEAEATEAEAAEAEAAEPTLNAYANKQFEFVRATKCGHGRWKCRHCQSEIQGSVYRRKQHLVGAVEGAYQHVRKCRKVPQELSRTLLQLSKAESEAAAANKRQKANCATLPELFRQQRQSSVKEVHSAAARLFFDASYSFATAANENWNGLLDAVRRLPEGTEVAMPDRKTMGGSLLVGEYDRSQHVLSRELQEVLPKYGCCLSSDGFSSMHNVPFINCMQVCAGRELLLDCVNATKIKKAPDVAEFIERHIRGVGAENVVLVSVDGHASSCFPHLVDKFPKIEFKWCPTHCMDLFLEDIYKDVPFIHSTIDSARCVIKFLFKNQKIYNMLLTRSDLALLRPGLTRFATHWIAGRRLLKLKTHCMDLVNCKEYESWVKVQKKEKKEKEKKVRAIVLDREFWDHLDSVMTIMKPFVKVLRLMDGSTPGTLGKVYYRMEQLKLLLQDPGFHSACTKTEEASIKRAFTNRWNDMHNSIDSAAYLLDPEFVGEKYGLETKINVVSDWHRYIARLFEPEECMKLTGEMREFRAERGLFDLDEAKVARGQLGGHEWWEIYGAHTPMLQRLAMRLLSQCVSASPCERNWSTFVWLLGKKRMRMSDERLKKLMSIQHASRAQKRAARRDVVPWMEDEERLYAEPASDMSSGEEEALALAFNVTRGVSRLNVEVE
eukprot:GHVU01054079.1.p1 GENE.GHVU01054079.1~~GHVU01054079.1.p1  ORF type:complete len:689 (+),score=121.17 GHVU01054079.1:195-2261(+)